MIKVTYQLPEMFEVTGEPVRDHISTFANEYMFVDWLERSPIYILIKKVETN